MLPPLLRFEVIELLPPDYLEPLEPGLEKSDKILLLLPLTSEALDPVNT